MQQIYTFNIKNILDNYVIEIKQTIFMAYLYLIKINVDENPNSPAQMGVRGIPALFLFKDGEAIANKTGAAPKAALADWITSSI